MYLLTIVRGANSLPPDKYGAASSLTAFLLTVALVLPETNTIVSLPFAKLIVFVAELQVTLYPRPSPTNLTGIYTMLLLTKAFSVLFIFLFITYMPLEPVTGFCVAGCDAGVLPVEEFPVPSLFIATIFLSVRCVTLYLKFFCTKVKETYKLLLLSTGAISIFTVVPFTFAFMYPTVAVTLWVLDIKSIVLLFSL